MIIRLCLAAVVMLPVVAVAQSNPGPYGGLFGRAPARGGQDRTIVEARSSVGSQYDTAILPPAGTPTDPLDRGTGAGGSASLIVRHETDKFSALADGAATRVQYFQTPAYGVNMYSGNASIASNISRGLSAAVSASYSHSPSYGLYPSFDGTSVVDADARPGSTVPFSPYATQMMENESVYGSAGLTARLTERMEANASAYHQQTMFTTSDADLKVDGYSGRLMYRLARGLGVHVGYGVEHSDQAGDLGQDFDNESIDIGVDYSRAFSIARRTTLAFTTSTSLLKTGNSAREFRVNGSLSVSKQFRRTWSASAYVNRGTSFVPGFYEPLYTDSGGISVSGMFSKRLNFSVGVQGGLGEAAFSNTSGYDTVTAFSTLSFAINKYLGLYGQYTTYRYELPVNSNALGLSERLARQTVGFGLTAYIPVYKKMGQ